MSPERRTPANDAKLKIGAEVEVEVERILPGGMGLAHAHGQTLMVALAAPGDRVRVRVQNVRGAVVFASIVEVVTPSPVRVAPPCQYFGRCGGCDFQQLTYEAQLAAKAEIIRDCLRRVAHIEPPAEILITPSPAAWHYRSRAQWQYDRDGEQLGYFERGSHKVCDVIECPVIVPELQTLLSGLREGIIVGSLPEATTEFQAVAGDDGAVAFAPPVWETDVVATSRTINGERYSFDADCFFQINHALLAPLVTEAVRDARGELAVDLYCGVGLFTLPLARRFTRVIGIEGSATACAYARRNLADAGLTNGRVASDSVEEWLAAHAALIAPIDFVLLDPPRAGAGAAVVKGIINLRPRRIAYVSCDPATLARDLRSLTENGYRLDSVAAFDMFPQTHHVETIVHLAPAK